MSGEPDPPPETPPQGEPPAEPVRETPVEVAAPEPEIAEPVIEEAPPENAAPEMAAYVEEPVFEEPVDEEPLYEEPSREEPPHDALVDFGEPEPPEAPADFSEPWSPPELRPEDRTDLFGEIDIPMPGEPAPAPHARDAQRVLDVDLGRIKRTKRFGLAGTIFTVLFVAFVLAPVTWVGVYRFIEAPGTVLMFQRAMEGQSIRHQPVPIARMSPYIIRSVIAAEDQNFCTHHGFDVAAIQDAMEANADGGRVRGGSTISQQTAKNLFLWPSRSWIRKGFETYFTALTEFMWPKERIMEGYLNAAEWGDGVFGIEAASQVRFGVHAADLSPLQAARLAAVLPSPNRWRVDSPGPYVRRRAGTIVERAQVVRNEGMASCVLAIDPKPATPRAVRAR